MPLEYHAEGEKKLKEGDIIKAHIIALDPNDRRITLSLRDVEGREADVEAMKYVHEQRGGVGERKIGPSGRAGATLGDVLKEKLGDKVGDLPKS